MCAIRCTGCILKSQVMISFGRKMHENAEVKRLFMKQIVALHDTKHYNRNEILRITGSTITRGEIFFFFLPEI